MEWGNSGVFLLGRHEIQIIQTDIFRNIWTRPLGSP
jgi:hypothetical protein